METVGRPGEALRHARSGGGVFLIGSRLAVLTECGGYLREPWDAGQGGPTCPACLRELARKCEDGVNLVAAQD